MTWLPKWGEDRISAMVADRTDWCISRQRTWGVPIPIFYCKECGKELINDDTIKAVSKLFKEKGSGAWYETDAADILPEGTKCSCGCHEFTKEKDIMDVWFDSLLTSIAAKGVAPYKSVITHGMIVDSDGQKMSKSRGNGVSPHDIISEYGADILRLWVVSADYKTDMRISREILKQLSEAYRKIRNTARFILGNINDFDPSKDSVAEDKFTELDRFALMKLDRLIEKVTKAYADYEFHVIFHAIHNFCVVDMSSFYLDIIKDRLYTEKKDSDCRRAAQTVMFRILDALTRLIAPVLVYTSEEIWQFMPHVDGDDGRAVVLNEMPKASGEYESAEFAEKWEKLILIKSDVSKALELARNEKVIGKSLDASITIYADSETKKFLQSTEDSLETLFIVSHVTLADGEGEGFKGESGITVSASPAEGAKCERCWIHDETVGTCAAHPTLCKRCADVIGD